ncbi:MAG: hypothetical protein OEW48_09860, partial [Phycisphaerae bacterium]|nr:hypothetical protein [Phycisphaerae bacterium]
KDYVQMDTWSIRKTKPIQSQLKPIQSQLKPILCQNKANSNPNEPNFTLTLPESIPKISCLMAQGFLCCGHGLFMLWIKKEFFGENLQ